MSNAAKPILFSAPMIKALLREIKNPGSGKTQTRRIMKLQPTDTGVSWQFELKGRKSNIWANYPYDKFDDRENGLVGYCPYGKPGDLLYVRETYIDFGRLVDFGTKYYRADSDEELEPYYKWTPSIHMPRWASRITLEVTDVRVQRLKDISILDAISEGVTRDDSADYHARILGLDWSLGNGRTGCPRKAFHCLWTSINGPESWEANPWVWAVSFKPHLINVDRFVKERAAA